MSKDDLASDEALPGKSAAPSAGRAGGSVSTSEVVDLWKKGQYGPCLELLENLSSQRGGDWKVEANLVAVKALQGGEHLEQIRRREGIAAEAASHLPDSVLLLLNTAAVLVNSKQYPAALKLLEPAWQSLRASKEAAVADAAVLGTCFLLLDINMALGTYAEAAGIVVWLEQRYELVIEEKEEVDGRQGEGSTPESSHREDSENSGDSSQASPSARRSAEQAAKTVAGYNLSQLLLSYQARLRLVAGDLKQAKRDIRDLLAMDPCTPQALALKAELEVLRGNMRRAAKLVASSAEEATPGPADRAAMLCNMGCIQHQEAKHHAAALCYRQALQAAQGSSPILLAAGVERVQPGLEHAAAADSAIRYNLGLEAMLRREHDAALKYFQECVPAMAANPALWLRMAECCMEKALLSQPKASSETLQLGRSYAATAVDLFTSQLAALETPGQNGNGMAGGLTSLEHVLRANQRQQGTQGRLLALCALAFLDLHLEEPDAALSAARSLLEEAAPASKEWQLGQAYTSEALHQLGQAPQAADHLQAALAQLVDQPALADQAVGSEPAAADGSAAGEAPVEARVLLLVNLASTYFSLRDFTQAQEFAKAGAEAADNRDALLMHVYLQLCQGQTAAAVAQLKAFQLGV